MGFAQTPIQQPGCGIEFNEFAGKVIKHTKSFKLPIPLLTSGMDLNLTWKTYGRKEWHQLRRYPTVGLGIAYTSYGIESVYGNCVSLFPNITFPLATGKRLEWTMRIGDGVGYVTRHYSKTAPIDTLNNAIGGNINDYASITTDVRYTVNDHWDVQMGGNFSHISNGSFQQPNLGVNLAGAHIGLRYFPVTSHPNPVTRSLKPLRNGFGLAFNVGMALDQPPPPGGPKYPVYLACVYVTKKWINKNKMFIGVDYSYHESVYAFLRNNYIYAGDEPAHSYKETVFAGNEFLLGRVGIVLQLGWYLKDASLALGPYYEKLGGNFYLWHREKGAVKDFFLCSFLKAHVAVAELFEFGFGIGI